MSTKLLVLLLLLTCGGRGAARCRPGGPSYGDVLVEGIIGDASNLIPILASDSASHRVAGLIYNGLVKYDARLRLVGDLARSWEVSPDGLTITFRLRPGVRWHDGHPLTARDVAFTWRLMVDPRVPTPYAGDFLQVKEVRVLDDLTVQVVYKRPFAPALSSWGLSILPRHLLEGRDLLRSPLSRHPVGTGPFRFRRWLPGNRIELVANPGYFEGRPYLNGYVFRVIPDSATMLLELKAGGLDRMGLSPLQDRFQAREPWFRRRFRVYRHLAFSYTYLGFNLRDPLFADRRVRQAIAYALDKREIVQGVLLGHGVVATGPYKPDSPWYNPHVRRYPHDPDRARRLLREAGWRDSDGDGVLDRDGRPFQFVLLTNQGNPLRRRCAEIIQWRLAQVGIRVRIWVVEWAAFLKEFIDKRRFQAVILGWTIPQDPDLYDVWHSSRIDPPGLNFVGYANPEVDRLLEQARATFDPVRRRRLYFEVQRILAEDQPYVFLYVPEAVVALHRRFHGVKPAPAGIDYNLIRWYVPRGLQLRSFLTP